MGWIMGFEPMASRATIWRANQLRYTHHEQMILYQLTTLLSRKIFLFQKVLG